MNRWNNLIDLKGDSAPMEVINQRILSDATIEGTNLIVLVMAIMIACIGLNLNSVAVIIGAMLISPLMGGIVATGYGMAAYDVPLSANPHQIILPGRPGRADSFDLFSPFAVYLADR